MPKRGFVQWQEVCYRVLKMGRIPKEQEHRCQVVGTCQMQGTDWPVDQ
jgi:hypothetical protein